MDAWAIWDPYFAIAEQDPNTRVLTTTEGIVPEWSFYQANGDFAKANPHVVADVIDELAKVGAWSQAHLDETIAAITPRRPACRQGADHQDNADPQGCRPRANPIPSRLDARSPTSRVWRITFSS